MKLEYKVGDYVSYDTRDTLNVPGGIYRIYKIDREDPWMPYAGINMEGEHYWLIANATKPVPYANTPLFKVLLGEE